MRLRMSPPTCFRQVIETMDAACPEEQKHLQKFSVNAMLGLWCAPTDLTYHVRTSQHASDCPGYHMKRDVSYGIGLITTDYI